MLSPSFYEKMSEVMNEKSITMHQYARSPGHLRLVNAVAKSYGQFFNREIDPLNEVLISIGGDGAVNNAITSFLEEGDEVFIYDFNCLFLFFEDYTLLNFVSKMKLWPFKSNKKLCSDITT